MDSMGYSLFAVVVLLAANAFFVAAALIHKAFRFDDQLVRNVMVPSANVDKLRVDDSREKNERGTYTGAVTL